MFMDNFSIDKFKFYVSLFLALFIFPTTLLSKDEINFPSNTKNSVLFYNLDQDKVVYEYNPDLLLTPASLVKILTSATALTKMKPSKKFTTTLSYTKDFDKTKKTITGDLIIVGGGDPLLTSEKLTEIAQDIRSIGIKNIEGDLLIDNSLFDDHYFPSERNSKLYSSRAYNSLISAFSINFNTITISIYPTSVNSLATVNLYPTEIKNVKVINKVKTVQGLKTKITINRSTVSSEETITVSGYISKESNLIKRYCSIGDPIQTLGQYFISFLENEGIRLKGTIRRINPKTYKVSSSKNIIEFKGEPLSKIISSLNQYSNNFIADMLVKHLSLLSYPNSPGSLYNGVETIKNFLKNDVGIKTSFNIEDGSGLNIRNKLSSRQLVSILKYMFQRKDIFPEFLSSLAVPQEEGSLKDRGVKNKIRAKTGTLTQPVSVSNIAGFGWNSSGEMIVFAILENAKESFPVGIEDLRVFQDRLIDKFIN